MIKGFLFDYDGVMSKKSGGRSPSELLAQVIVMEPKEVDDLFAVLWPDYLRGKISEKEFWKIIESKSGKVIPRQQRMIWTTWEQLHPLPAMQRLVATLRTKGFPVGLLTNVTPTTEEEVRSHGGYDGFDFLVRSCRVGLAKPDVAIYQLALEKFSNVEPQEVAFIDDRERFLVPAQALGMSVVLARDAQQVIRDVLALAGVADVPYRQFL